MIGQIILIWIILTFSYGFFRKDDDLEERILNGIVSFSIPTWFIVTALFIASIIIHFW